MFKGLYNILLIAISFSFFISAIEMDLGESHNTFFDDYDTYVQPNAAHLNVKETAQLPQDASPLIYYGVSDYKKIPGIPAKFIHPNLYSYNPYPDKLFLHNSVWRI